MVHSLSPSRAAFAAVAASCLFALPAQAPPAYAAAVEAALAVQRERDGIPGLSCAIAVRGEVQFATGLGTADLENDVPATAATVYRLASISKPITAVAAMQLVEKGRLDLDADVRGLVKAWPEKQWPVTTRQLLGHLGGVRHYRRGEIESTRRFEDQTAGLVRFAADPLLHEPGTRYLYSTYGYNLVGAVVEQASGTTLADYVKQHIAAPSGAATLQDDDVRRIVKHRAAGYVRVDGELRNSALMDSSYKLGGGGFVCSAPDLVRFCIALQDGVLLRRETLATMWTPGTLRDGKATTYGLGFGVGSHQGRRVISHSGAQSRVSTVMHMLPDQRIAVVLLCNLEGVRLGPLARDLAAQVAAATAEAK